VDREAVDGSSLSARLRRWTAGGDVELLILLDQFEEYFLYHPGTDERFDDEFAAAVNDRELRASFLVSLREDAFAQLDRFKARIPQLLDSYRRVDELDAQAARAAIVRPIDQYNQLLGPGEEPFKVEDRLVELIVDSVASGRLETEAHVGEPPARTVEAAYLQIVLARLWREERAQGSRTMRAETLEQLGGAAQAVRTHLDRALDALPPEQQRIAADASRYLITPSGSKIAQAPGDLALDRRSCRGRPRSSRRAHHGGRADPAPPGRSRVRDLQRRPGARGARLARALRVRAGA
jgi:Novel STAND NTPase 1